MQTENMITISTSGRQFDRLMIKSNNDTELVTQILTKKAEKKLAKKLALIQYEQEVKSSLELLAEAGFPKVNKNVKLLMKFSGEVDPVLSVLLKRQEKKLERKLKKSSLKDSGKICKKEKFQARKLAHKLAKNEPKQFKKEKKEKRVAIPDEPMEVEWSNVQHLFLDGNNMLFVPSELRSLTLKRARRTAEKRLNQLAREFQQGKGVPQVTLLFDNTSLSEQDEHFLLKSSRPEFTTSDDELVSFAQVHQGPQFVFVTSDRGLRERLLAFGVTLMKPGRWFSAVEELLGSRYKDILSQSE